MDKTSLIGVILALVAVGAGMVLKGVSLAVLLNPAVLLIIILGTIAAVVIAFPANEIKRVPKLFKILFTEKNEVAPEELIKTFSDWAIVARKEGLLSLEEAAADLDDAFLKKGILLIVDGTDPELVRGIMETELSSIDSRHKQNMTFWQDLGSMGPAWGMIGTLIGLVNMLQNLSDPSAIGPNMAVALLTTLYGSLLANWICTPVASKLKANNDTEIMVKEIMVEGLLSIQAGENPRVIEEKLKSFLAPKDRDADQDEGGEMDV